MPENINGQSAFGGEGGNGPVPGDGPAIGDEFRKRAGSDDDKAKSEARIADLLAQIEELKAELARVQEAGQAQERRRRIEQAVAASDPLDPETVQLLVERAIGPGDGSVEKVGADANGVVADLKRRKPFLFRKPPASPSAMSVVRAGTGGVTPAELADQARATGDKRALLQYLRARRGG